MHNRIHTQHTVRHTQRQGTRYIQSLCCFIMAAERSFRCSIMFFAGDFFYNSRLLIAFHDTVRVICVSSRISHSAYFWCSRFKATFYDVEFSYYRRTKYVAIPFFFSVLFTSTFDSRNSSPEKFAFLNLCSQTSWREFMYQLLEFFFICMWLQSRGKCFSSSLLSRLQQEDNCTN